MFNSAKMEIAKYSDGIIKPSFSQTNQVYLLVIPLVEVSLYFFQIVLRTVPLKESVKPRRGLMLLHSEFLDSNR